MTRGLLPVGLLLLLIGLALVVTWRRVAVAPSGTGSEALPPPAEAPPPLLGAQAPAREAVADLPPLKAGEPRPSEGAAPASSADSYTVRGRLTASDPARAVPQGTLVATITNTQVDSGKLDWKVRQIRTISDPHGRFSFDVVGTPAPVLSRFQFVDRTLRVLRWTVDGHRTGMPMEVEHGETIHVRVELAAVFRLQGVVVDEAGRGLSQVAISFGPLDNKSEIGAVVDRQTVYSDEHGRFDIGPFEPTPPPKRSSALEWNMAYFQHGQLAVTRLDPWGVDQDERGDLRVVVDRGVNLGGQLVGPAGEALPSVVIEVLYGDGSRLRRAVRTDEHGAWRLDGLTRGRARLRALAIAHGCLASRQITIRQDDLHLDLEAEALPPIERARVHDVLGLRLVNVDERIRVAYDLHRDISILILDAQEGHEQLGLGTLEPGAGFMVVGHEYRPPLLAAVTHLLAASKPSGGGKLKPVRVTLSIADERERGARTRELRLSTKDREALEVLAERLKDR